MLINKNSKLFYVEFGEPDFEGFSIFTGKYTQLPLFVIAKSYDEAVSKALLHVETTQESGSVISSDGSLDLNKDEIKIKSIRLASDEIIF